MTDPDLAGRIQAMIERHMQASPGAVPAELEAAIEKVGAYHLSTVKQGLVQTLGGAAPWRAFGLDALGDYTEQLTPPDVAAIESCLLNAAAEIRVSAALLYGRGVQSEALLDAVVVERDPVVLYALLSCGLALAGAPDDRVRQVAQNVVDTRVVLTRQFVDHIVAAVVGTSKQAELHSSA